MPFKAGYKTQIYALHQKGTILSDKAVAPSQYDLSLGGHSNTTQQQHQKRLYIHAFT